MRTRLDEIVEEESENSGCFTTDVALAMKQAAAVKRIAERSFHEGLRAAAVQEHGPRYLHTYDFLKPAPAEEKPEVHTWAEKPKNGPVYEWKYMGGPLINDRRKGQRRKGKEQVHMGRWHLGCSHPFDCISSTDRRSGQDRRKP